MTQYEYLSYRIPPKQKDEIEDYLTFLSKLVMHCTEFATNKSKAMPIAIIAITLRR